MVRWSCDCEGDFKCPFCKGKSKTKPEHLFGACKEQDDRLSGERDQSVEGRDALNIDSALPAPDSKAKEQDDKRMDELGITEQDIAETKPPEPGR